VDRRDLVVLEARADRVAGDQVEGPTVEGPMEEDLAAAARCSVRRLNNTWKTFRRK
jgi:hypothetical protein